MKSLLHRFLRDRRAELDEAAFVLPVLILVSVAIINLAMLGTAALSAGNAANYGARMGSVAVENQAAVAASAASQAIDAARVGEYAVNVTGGGQPGTIITVSINFSVPNYFGGLARLFGASVPDTFTGLTQSYFRQEGW